jgi:hypothetical protein
MGIKMQEKSTMTLTVGDDTYEIKDVQFGGVSFQCDKPIFAKGVHDEYYHTVTITYASWWPWWKRLHYWLCVWDWANWRSR